MNSTETNLKIHPIPLEGNEYTLSRATIKPMVVHHIKVSSSSNSPRCNALSNEQTGK